VGTLVHRLFQRKPAAHLDVVEIARLVPLLFRPDELTDVADRAALADHAAALFVTLRSKEDLQTLLAAGKCHYEVPFSAVTSDEPQSIVRGRLDCLVQHDDGGLTIVEFKTGRFRPEHEMQVTIYVNALRAAMPGTRIQARIFYP